MKLNDKKVVITGGGGLLGRYVVMALKKRGVQDAFVRGTGHATREFLYVEDAAEGIVLATENYDEVEPINLGTGTETTIREVTELIMKIVGYNGKIKRDVIKPGDQPRRRLDISRARREFGFVTKTTLHEGLKKTIEWYELQTV